VNFVASNSVQTDDVLGIPQYKDYWTHKETENIRKELQYIPDAFKQFYSNLTVEVFAEANNSSVESTDDEADNRPGTLSAPTVSRVAKHIVSIKRTKPNTKTSHQKSKQKAA